MDHPLPSNVACVWNPLITNGTVLKNATDIQCSQMIASVVKNKDAQVLFIGDSTMFRLWREARVFQNGKPFSSKLITTSHCNWLQSFGIKSSKVSRKPNPKKEGPSADILMKPQRNGCTTETVLSNEITRNKTSVVFLKEEQLQRNIPGTNFLSMDMITVCYAKDVEMQSVLGNTSQETLSRYLQLEHQIYSLCVLNMGLHDQKLIGLQTKDYVSNVIEFLELMSPVCLYIIWIETTAPRGDPNRPQTIARTREWNVALYSYLDGHRHINVSMMRVFEKSLKAPHDDNVHLHRSWYAEMARTMFEDM